MRKDQILPLSLDRKKATPLFARWGEARTTPRQSKKKGSVPGEKRSRTMTPEEKTVSGSRSKV